MPFTLIHHRNSLQLKLVKRGATLSACRFRLGSWRQGIQGGHNDWPTTEAELREAGIGVNELIALKESDQMTNIEKQLYDAAISAGVKDLAARFRRNHSIPSIPNNIYEKAHESIPQELHEDPYGTEDLDLDYWLEHYPNLDKYTAKALLEKSDNDRFSPIYMFAIGAYFVSQSWTDGELKQWYEGFNEVGGTVSIDSARPTWPPKTKSGKLAPTKRAKLIARLTWDVMNYSMSCSNIGDLEHTAGLIKNLSLQDLQVEADQAHVNVSDRNNKAALVVALVEHIYSDVIEPALTA